MKWAAFTTLFLLALGVTGCLEMGTGPGGSNEAPVVSILEPTDGATFTADQTVTLEAAATDADGDIASLSWSSSLNGSLGTGPTLAVTLSVGSHTITARATDSQGETTSASVSVTIEEPNTAPTVGITLPAEGGVYNEGQAITFEATASDPDGHIASITWSSDQDGTLGSGASLSYSGLSRGSHTITAAAVDDRGATATASLGLEIQQAQPRIAFVSYRAGGTGGVTSLYVMNPDGSGMSSLTETGHYGAPKWSPDGTRLAFVKYAASGAYELHVMNADGSGIVQLTSSDQDVRSVAWAPDGTEIAFTRSAGIEVVAADGSASRVLTTETSNYVAWSPDGRTIVFSQSYNGLRALDLVTGSITELTTDQDYDAVFSRDGGSIAFVRENVGYADESAVFVMNADGSGQTQLTTPMVYTAHPAWSPAGDRIAFHWLKQTGTVGYTVISTVDPSGGGITTLTDDGSERSDRFPTWSP